MFPILERSQGWQLSRREQEASQVHRTIKLIHSPTNSSPRTPKLIKLLSGHYVFVSIAIETLGAWGPSALDVTTEIDGRIAKLSAWVHPIHGISVAEAEHCYSNGTMAAG